MHTPEGEASPGQHLARAFLAFEAGANRSEIHLWEVRGMRTFIATSVDERDGAAPCGLGIGTGGAHLRL